jgi:hypothetical protein
MLRLSIYTILLDRELHEKIGNEWRNGVWLGETNQKRDFVIFSEAISVQMNGKDQQ